MIDYIVHQSHNSIVTLNVYQSEWRDPTFIQPKTNGTVQFLSNFSKLYQRICRNKFPIPKIQDTVLKLSGLMQES